MKYFIRTNLHQEVHEVTSEYALKHYRQAHGKGMENIVVQPLFRKGLPQTYMGVTVWGENISSKELFRRRLEGSVAKEVVGNDN